jgi:site-specific DNA-methyltransferase (adenine-specific)
MKNIPDKSIDMILCDLPYGTRIEKWDEILNKEILWIEYNRIIKDGGCIALFGSEPFSSYLRMSNIKNYKYDWVWDKDQGGNFALAKKQPLKTHEEVCIFNSKIYFPIMAEADKKNIRPVADGYKVNDYIIQIHSKDYDNTRRYPKSIIKHSANNKECNKLNRFHPTQKPVALLEYLIKTYTLEGETVLDNCMGSGSTGVACINTNRKFIGIEKDDKYFEIAKNRIEQARQDAEQKMF